MSTAPRSAVERYHLEFWNERRFELADEIIGEQLVRNELDGRVALTRADARKRAEETWAAVEHIEFSLLHTIAENDLVTTIYQADITRRNGTTNAFAGIEVLRVRDGRIVEVWNHARQHGRWPDGAAT
jgi:hypothetical protein